MYPRLSEQLKRRKLEIVNDNEKGMVKSFVVLTETGLEIIRLRVRPTETENYRKNRAGRWQRIDN